MKSLILAIVVLAAAGGASWWAWHTWGHREAQAAYRTVFVECGDVIQTVRATGTVQPVKLVQVGTQVNGRILKLGVDFNSHVKANDVVAQIDPAVYKAGLEQSQANLAHSVAAVDDARATLLKASNDLTRANGLAKRDLLSASDLDTTIAAEASAAAGLKEAMALVKQNEASLQLAQANLDYTTINAPVDGVVVSRNVDEGQTVVASMTAQTLFTIATDLRTILINASVPESDVGPIRGGQRVTFNVDAYPITFTGVVDQVRLAASTVQNVVTYPVMVRASNPEEKLFPGMTANISCIVTERTNVLKVANAALRFKPNRGDRANGNGQTAGAADGGRHGENRPKLWVQRPEGGLRPIHVTVGISDGNFTEVSGDEVQEKLEVVTGVAESGAKDTVVNPFMPSATTPGGQRRPPRM